MSFDFKGWNSSLEPLFPAAFKFLKVESSSSSPWQISFYSEPVELPAQTLSQIKLLIEALFRLKKQESYWRALPSPFSFPSFSSSSPPSSSFPALSLRPKKQDSVLMGYDFHLSEKGPILIELNSNASGFLLNYSRACFEGLSFSEDPLKSLQQAFISEWQKFKAEKEEQEGGACLVFGPSPKKVVLIDEKPFQQPMFPEFLMFKDFFPLMGWPSCEICDSSTLKTDERGFLFTEKGERVDFVYNRTTDFYFERHPHLARAFALGGAAISPHPIEYWLLADKQRLCDWFAFAAKGKYRELKGVKELLPFSVILNESNREEFWKSRKKYFFKIPRGYGGKQAYRGLGLTRKTFDRLCGLGGLVQEYIPPLKLESETGKWKTDFRAYVYEDKIQQLCARVYRGQVTNFREKGSGFAPVLLS